MILDKLDSFKYKYYSDPVWFNYNFTRDFYFGIALWLRTYEVLEYGDENESTMSKTIILWVPFFKFIFSWEYVVDSKTKVPYREHSPAYIYVQEAFKKGKEIESAK